MKRLNFEFFVFFNSLFKSKVNIFLSLVFFPFLKFWLKTLLLSDDAIDSKSTIKIGSDNNNKLQYNNDNEGNKFFDWQVTKYDIHTLYWHCMFIFSNLSHSHSLTHYIFRIIIISLLKSNSIDHVVVVVFVFYSVKVCYESINSRFHWRETLLWYSFFFNCFFSIENKQTKNFLWIFVMVTTILLMMMMLNPEQKFV